MSMQFWHCRYCRPGPDKRGYGDHEEPAGNLVNRADPDSDTDPDSDGESELVKGRSSCGIVTKPREKCGLVIGLMH